MLYHVSYDRSPTFICEFIAIRIYYIFPKKFNKNGYLLLTNLAKYLKSSCQYIITRSRGTCVYSVDYVKNEFHENVTFYVAGFA